jgi:apolipoprotein N-acyltransferase
MYKNYLLSILSGFLLALAWPTYGFSLLIFLGFVPLLLAERNSRINSPKHDNLHTFFVSYITFLIWNTITTWWIWNSTEVGGAFAIVVNSLLMTLVFQFYHLIAKRKTQRFALLFLVSLWIAFEKFHLTWEFSWPWLNLGNVFSEQPQWIQWYEYTGIFGGSLWIWIVNISIFNAIVNFQQKSNTKIAIKKLILSFSFIVLGIFISLYQYNTYKEKGEVFTAILLQPNTDPYTEKYHQSSSKIAIDLLRLTATKMDDEVRYILAPETVFSRKTTVEKFQASSAYQNLQSYLSKYPQSNFLSGIDLWKVYNTPIMPSATANRFSNTDQAWYESFNAAIQIANGSNIPQVYNKSKLVVGVEHFPFRSVLQPLLGDVMIDLGGSVATITPQKEAEIFIHQNQKLKAAPIICYESIYGEYTGEFIKKKANFLAIITNDSWWGNTQGHKQLLSYARLRAVEHRRSIARSANSGISAFINQKGDIISRLDYETRGALKGQIQANEKITFYSKHGDFIARIASFVAVLFFLVGMFAKKAK